MHGHPESEIGTSETGFSSSKAVVQDESRLLCCLHLDKLLTDDYPHDEVPPLLMRFTTSLCEDPVLYSYNR